MSKLTLSIMPPKGQLVVPFIDIVRQTVESFFGEDPRINFIPTGQLELGWYDDFPASDEVVLTATFTTVEVFDALAELQLALRKQGYSVNVSLIPPRRERVSGDRK